jgi:hypothetical protein
VNSFLWLQSPEGFRSTCGSERGAPQCTTQRRPAATPHVGHGTDDNCFVVSSFFPVENCPMTPYCKTIPFGTLLGTSRSRGESQLLLLLINALPESSRVHSGCIVGNPESAGINRHVVGDERALQERRAANPSWPRVLQVISRGIA